MQDGMLLIPRDDEAVFCVRRSFERAGDESFFPDIRPIKGFRDAVPAVPAAAARQVIHLEIELVPLALVAAIPKALFLQGGGVAGCADRPGPGGQEPVRAGHHGTMRRHAPARDGGERAGATA